MSGDLRYTSEEMAVIDGMIGNLYSRMTGDELRKTYHILHQHLERGVITQIDLHCISDALAFIDPGQCVSSTKESYREFTSLRLKTQAMLSALA